MVKLLLQSLNAFFFNTGLLTGLAMPGPEAEIPLEQSYV